MTAVTAAEADSGHAARAVTRHLAMGVPVAVCATPQRLVEGGPVRGRCRGRTPPRRRQPLRDERELCSATQTKETKEKIIAELNQLNEKAQAKDAYGAAVSAVLGKAKVLNLMNDQPQETKQVDFNSAQSMQDIGRKLLQSIGFKEPDDVSIQEAMKANDEFIKELERIRNAAKGIALEQRGLTPTR